jgi:hypothetical protein
MKRVSFVLFFRFLLSFSNPGCGLGVFVTVKSLSVIVVIGFGTVLSLGSALNIKVVGWDRALIIWVIRRLSSVGVWILSYALGWFGIAAYLGYLVDVQPWS